MNLKKLLTDDTRAVSPVIGVILMVAVTVILAAVIGAFVLGLGDEASSTTPQAQFSYDFDDDTNVTITHTSGDNIDNETVRVTVDGVEGFPNPASPIDTADGWNDTISTGDDLELYNGSEDAEIADRGDTVRIIWEDPSGGESNTLSQREWP